MTRANANCSKWTARLHNGGWYTKRVTRSAKAPVTISMNISRRKFAASACHGIDWHFDGFQIETTTPACFTVRITCWPFRHELDICSSSAIYLLLKITYDKDSVQTARNEQPGCTTRDDIPRALLASKTLSDDRSLWYLARTMMSTENNSKHLDILNKTWLAEAIRAAHRST